MLLDPRSSVRALDGGQPGWSFARQHPVARRRPAHDFLTLPSLPPVVPAHGRLNYGDEADLKEFVIAQFRAGVLDTEAVVSPHSAGDAFAQGFNAWLGPRLPKTRALKFDFVLVDHASVLNELSEFGWDPREESALYLGIRLEEENVYTLTTERAEALRSLHPCLVYTLFHLIRAATGKSLYVRTPDDLLDMFARWHWDCEPLTDDNEARECLAERFGEGDSDIERCLPSVVRPELAPDESLPKHAWMQKDRKLSALSRRRLRELARRSPKDWRGKLCGALADLDLALEHLGKSSLLVNSQWAEPAYSAATIAYADSDYVGEVLDDHYECASGGGFATYFQCFIPLASKPAAIRKQYAVLENTLELIAALDRMLEHLL